MEVLWNEYGFVIRWAVGLAGMCKIGEVIYKYRPSRKGRRNADKNEYQPENLKPTANSAETIYTTEIAEALQQLINQIAQLGQRIELLQSKDRVAGHASDSQVKEVKEIAVSTEVQEVEGDQLQDVGIGEYWKELCEAIRTSFQKKLTVEDLEGICVKLEKTLEYFIKYDEFQEEIRAWKASIEAIEQPPVDSQKFEPLVEKALNQIRNETITNREECLEECEEKFEKFKKSIFWKTVEELELTEQHQRKALEDIRVTNNNKFEIHEKRFEAIEKSLSMLSSSMKANDFMSSGKKSHAVKRVHKLDDDYDGNVVFQWRISGIKAKLQGLMQDVPEAITTESFNLGDDIKVTPSLLTSDGGGSLLVELDFTSLDDKPIRTLQFLHSRRYVLFDQSTDGPTEDIVLVDRAYFGITSVEVMRRPNFNNCQLCLISLLMDNAKYVKDDAIMIAIYLEPISYISKSITSNSGVLVWKIDNYSLKKQYEIDGGRLWYTSEPFKTSPDGYTMHLDVFLNGDDNFMGKYISVYLQFILGKHDSSLPVPFCCRFSFQLVDQSEDGQETITFGESYRFNKSCLSWGVPNFVPHSVVEMPKYLKNDSIVIKAEVNLLELEINKDD